MYIYFVLFAVIMTALGFLFIVLRDRFLIKQINQCIQSEGKEIKSPTEIKELLLDILKQQNSSIAPLRELSNNMMHISGQLTYSSEEFNIAMKEITAGAKAMAAGAEEQSQNAAYIEQNIKNIFEKSEQNLNSCDQTKEISANSYRRIVDRRENIQGIIGEFDEVVNRIYKADHSVKQLKNSYQNIESMIEGIKHISSQTNLLSLNASIEAARAGEQGKGFAVVALEVKKLAEESSKVVEDIILLIRQMMQDTDSTGALMNEAVGVLSEQFSKLKGSVVDMEDIEKNISAIVQDIAVLSENDRALVKEYESINNTIRSLNMIAEENKHQVAAVSESIKDEANSVENILSISKQLEGLSKGLFKQINGLDKRDEGSVVVAVSEYPPFLVEHEDGTSFSGIDIDIMNEVFRRKNIKPIYKSYPFEQTLELMKEGFVDIIPTLSYKKERETYMDFSMPYRETTKFVFIAKTDSQASLRKMEDLERYTIGVVKGFNYPAEFAQNTRIVKDESLSVEIMLSKLVKGQVDGAIINEFTLGEYITKHNLKGKVKLLDYAILDNTSDSRMTFAKKNNLYQIKALFEEGFEEIKRDGTLEKIYQRYTRIN